VDEVIGVTGFDGAVLEIDLRSTEIKALDGRIVNIPNANILSSPIINYTRANRRRIELPLPVGYDTDTEATRTMVLEALQNVPGFVSEPAPVVGFSNFRESALELNTYFWIDTSKTSTFAAKDSAFALIKNVLDKQGIKVPFPTRTVYMHSEN
jgi:small-conductance mechanosensitive channel